MSTKNGIAISTKWLSPCQMVVGKVEMGIGEGANMIPTADAPINTKAIGTLMRNKTKNVIVMSVNPSMFNPS
jgi:hypothetical protein